MKINQHDVITFIGIKAKEMTLDEFVELYVLQDEDGSWNYGLFIREKFEGMDECPSALGLYENCTGAENDCKKCWKESLKSIFIVVRGSEDGN